MKLITRFDEAPYVRELIVYVRNFHQKGDWLWNFSCPICGDSDKDKLKARGYIFSPADAPRLCYKCHNCGASASFDYFLKKHFPDLHRKYQADLFLKPERPEVTLVRDTPMKKPRKRVIYKPDLPTILDLMPLHSARIYCERVRKIPKKGLKRLYYTDDFKSWLLSHADATHREKYKNITSDNSERIVMPCIRDDELYGVQARSFTHSKEARFVTAKLIDDPFPLVFGSETIDHSRLVFICEGPIDSLFFPNTIAALGSDLPSTANTLRLSRENTVLLFDNEPRSKEICKLIRKAILNSWQVCLWPHYIEQKDINDMVISGMTKKQVVETAMSNVFSGIMAEVQFEIWRKTNL